MMNIKRLMYPNGDSSKVSLSERFLGNVGVTGFGGLVFGFAAAILLLVGGPERFTIDWLAVRYFWTLAVLFFVLGVVKLFVRNLLPRLTQWGAISLALLGFGLGMLVYQFHRWGEWLWLRTTDGLQWLWGKFILIDNTDKWMLTSLFLIGVIMGFYVVRNWSKEQGDFTKSLTGAVGGAFVASLLGPVSGNADTKTSFAFYALGFTLSGVINLIVASFLIRSYSNNTQLRNKRAVLSFLYGPDKADDVDKQFVKNFQDDPVYVRRLLISAVKEYQTRLLHGFARRREELRKEHEKDGLTYYQLLAIECEKDEQGLPDESLASPPETPPSLKSPPEDPTVDDQKVYSTIFRKISATEPLTDEMFRIATSFKWRDNLEYLDAPGAFRKPMQYFSSVSGLALFVRHTIVMDRDKLKRFRTSEYPNGLCPAKIEQPRGLDEIDFLSYIVVPMDAYRGQPEETPLGLLHLDTKLFAARVTDLPADLNCNDNGVCKASFRASRLTELANNIYETDDKAVKYIEDMKGVLVPILELYLKSRQGSA